MTQTRFRFTGLSRLDKIFYGGDEVYRWDEARRRTFQQETLCEAFAHHHAHCTVYRRYCEVEGVHPDAVRSHDDLQRIPLLPTSLFKSFAICSVRPPEVEKICTSSGTRGSLSRVPRDRTTLERLVGSVRLSNDELLGLGPDACLFILAPPPEEAPDVWLPYVLGLIALLRPATYYARGHELEAQRLVDDLRRLPPGSQPVLTGPPPFLLQLLEHLEARAMCFDLGTSGGRVVTVGGWKRSEDRELDRGELASRCARQLGISDCGAFRDFYNMVELNTVVFECERRRKHIPPWLLVSPRDPETLRPLPAGATGLLGFLDPSPVSYPGFLLSDDFGRLNEGCECGRSGPILEFVRRVRVVEGRGCARTLERKAEGAEPARQHRAPALVSEPAAWRLAKRAGSRMLQLWTDAPEDVPPELPTVVIVPPFSRTAREMLVFAFFLVENGFRAVRFDFTDHPGLSEGCSRDFTLSSAAEDVWAATHIARLRYPDSPVAVLSASLGSRVCLRALRHRDDVSLLVSLVGVYDVRDTLRRAVGHDYLGDYREGRPLPASVTINGCPVEAGFVVDAVERGWDAPGAAARELSDCAFPVLELAAEEDHWVRLNDVAGCLDGGSGYPRELVLLRDTGHHLGHSPPAIRAAMQEVMVRLWREFLPRGTEALSPRAPDFQQLVELCRRCGVPRPEARDASCGATLRVHAALDAP